MKVDQTNILHKVHKNVKFMLSEIRQIIREKHILCHASKKGSEALTPIRSHRQNSSNFGNNFKKQSNLLDRYKQIRSKQKPYMSSHDSPTKDNGQRSKLTYRFVQRQRHKQSDPYISMDQKSQKSLNRKEIQNLRLPTIKNGRNKKRYYNSQNYCLTLSIEDNQPEKKYTKKNVKTIPSNQNKKARINSQIIRPEYQKFRQCISGQNIKAFTYSPWQSRQQQNDPSFENQ